MSTTKKTYSIIQNEIFGRHLVATRDISPGESIIDEPPLVSGPVSNTLASAFSDTNIEDSVCLVCCTNISIFHECEKCGLLLCSISCSVDPLHVDQECKVFQKLQKSQTLKFPSHKILFNFILTIRGIFISLSSELKWNQILQLESKVAELEKVGAFSEFNSLFGLLKWEYFTNKNKITTTTTTSPKNISSVAKCCLGAMRTNAFSTFTSTHSREGLYFLSSFMSHSCVMNTDRQIQPETGRMVTRAAKVIKQGEPITTSYLSYMNSTPERWTETRKTWIFTCRCERCVDPTELGTNLSTIICPACAQMTLSPCVDLNDFIWTCANQSCSYKCSYANSDGNNDAWKVLEDIETARPKDLKDICEIENWLECSKGKVHKNHSIFTQIKLYLCQYYGRNVEGGITGLSDDQLIRKTKYCSNILEIFDKLFCGVYMIRGVIFFELWSSLQEVHRRIANINVSNQPQNHPNPFKSIDISDDRINITRSDAMRILEFALPNSQEESMFHILRDAGQ